MPKAFSVASLQYEQMPSDDDVVARLANLMREQHTQSEQFPFAPLDREAVKEQSK